MEAPQPEWVNPFACILWNDSLACLTSKGKTFMKQSRQKWILLALCVLIACGACWAVRQTAIADAKGVKNPDASFSADVPEDFYRQGLVTVYVTLTGARYHSRPDCGNSQTSDAVTLEEAIRLGYTPCKKCKPPPMVATDGNISFPKGATLVYIAVQDEYDHTKIHGSQKYPFVLVTLEEAEYLGRTPCPKCAD